MDLRASILFLARNFLLIAEYPIQEQVIFFLHILHRRLNKTKSGAPYAREVRILKNASNNSKNDYVNH